MNTPSHFKVLVAAATAKDHVEMTVGARPFFAAMAAENGFGLNFTEDAGAITDDNLADTQVFVMLNLAPFDMSQGQQGALQAFIERGGGFVGVHAAGLTGREFVAPTTPYWQWFEDLLGGITYTPHPAYQTGLAVVEDPAHPVMRNVSARFALADEWYEFNQSPRGRVRVLATADEASYRQNKPMGDHPMVWVNEHYRRAIYIALGHDSSALKSPDYAALLRDAILWAATPGGAV